MSQDVITRRLQIIKKLKEEKKLLSNTIKDILEDDPSHQQMKAKMEEFKNSVKVFKSKQDENHTLQDLKVQLKDKGREIKEMMEVLSQELADYYRSEGVMEIEDEDGNIKRIKFNASLID